MEMEVPNGLVLAAPPQCILPGGPVEQEEEEQMEDDTRADALTVVSRPPAERERQNSRSPRGHSGDAAAADAPELPSYMASFHRSSTVEAAAIMVRGCPAGHHRVGATVAMSGLITRPDMNSQMALIVAWDQTSHAYLCKHNDELYMIPRPCLVTCLASQPCT